MATLSKILRTVVFSLGYVPTPTEWTGEFDKPYNGINAIVDVINGVTTISNSILMSTPYTAPLLLGTVRVWSNAGVLYAKAGYDPATAIDGVRIGGRAGTKIRNATAGTLSAGTIVYISGTYTDANGQEYPTVAKAVSTQSVSTTKYGWAVIAADVLTSADGEVVFEYELTGLDTSTKAVGDRIYLSSTGGGYLKSWSDFSDVDFRCQVVGFVKVSSATVGRIVLCNWSIIPWQPIDPTGI